mmetsp:Transcript_72781/g.157965  ORF Transcript_72781/g.157965 Transcript_72781/m.157965 type:complete len:313 (-) Transcript_72781:428-1366(-)
MLDAGRPPSCPWRRRIKAPYRRQGNGALVVALAVALGLDPGPGRCRHGLLRRRRRRRAKPRLSRRAEALRKAHAARLRGTCCTHLGLWQIREEALGKRGDAQGVTVLRERPHHHNGRLRSRGWAVSAFSSTTRLGLDLVICRVASTKTPIVQRRVQFVSRLSGLSWGLFSRKSVSISLGLLLRLPLPFEFSLPLPPSLSSLCSSDPPSLKQVVNLPLDAGRDDFPIHFVSLDDFPKGIHSLLLQGTHGYRRPEHTPVFNQLLFHEGQAPGQFPIPHLVALRDHRLPLHRMPLEVGDHLLVRRLQPVPAVDEH